MLRRRTIIVAGMWLGCRVVWDLGQRPPSARCYACGQSQEESAAPVRALQQLLRCLRACSRRPPKRNFWALRVFWPRLDATGGARETGRDKRNDGAKTRFETSSCDFQGRRARKSHAPALLAHCKFSGHNATLQPIARNATLAALHS